MSILSQGRLFHGRAASSARLAELSEPRQTYPWKLHFLMLSPLLAALLVIGCALGLWGEPVRLWHESLRQSHPFVTLCMSLISKYGVPAAYSVYGFILLDALARSDRRALVLLFKVALGSLLFALLLTQAFKAGFGLPRPGYPMPPRPFSFLRAYGSFPSAHTVSIIAAALPLGLWFRKWPALACAALAVALVGYSRLWLGMHHPVDILAGCIVGSMAARFAAVERRGAYAFTGRMFHNFSAPPKRLP